MSVLVYLVIWLVIILCTPQEVSKRNLYFQNQRVLMTVRKRGDSHFTQSTLAHTIHTLVSSNRVCSQGMLSSRIAQCFLSKALFHFLVLNYLAGIFSQQLLLVLVFHSSLNKLFHPYPTRKLEEAWVCSHWNILMLISLRKAAVFALKSFNLMEGSSAN